MKDFDLNTWLFDTAQSIADELKDADENEHGDRFYELLNEEIERAVIYYSDAVAIVSACQFFSGYDEHEMAPFKNMSQIAFAGLYDEASEKMQLKENDGTNCVELTTPLGNVETIKIK